MEDTLEARLKKIIMDTLVAKEEELNKDTTFESLGADSLDEVELLMYVEDEFDIDISDKEAEEIETIGDALSIVETKLAKS